jgi:hypothetical protein
MKTILKLPLIGLIFLAGCANLISSYDQNSYYNAQNLKIESLALVDASNTPATFHAEQITVLQDKLSFAYAYEQGKGKSNAVSCKQWDILINPKGSLLGSYLESWKNGAEYSPDYIQEKRIQISDGFDEIIRLEGAKADRH